MYLILLPPPPAGRWPPGGDTSDRPDFSDWGPPAEIGAFKPGQPDPGLPPYPGIQTPNLDRFASTAASFRAAYVQQAICGATRASLLTGRRVETTRVHPPHLRRRAMWRRTVAVMRRWHGAVTLQPYVNDTAMPRPPTARR